MTIREPRRAALLLLADGRLPAGGYAHSGGLEPAIAAGHVADVADVERFLAGRLRTTGLVTATFAAASWRASRSDDPATELATLEVALDARTPSPAQRAVSRQLGRQLVRAVAAIAPRAQLDALDPRPHQPLALGVAFAELGLDPEDAALACLHETAAGPVAAAVRLLSTDPFATHGALARLGPLIDELTTEAVTRSRLPDDLPAHTGPLLDVGAERHRTSTTRLFAS